MNLNKAFEILELFNHKTYNYSADEIKRQYHRLALKYHPDKNKDDLINSTIKFQHLHEAYEYLSSDCYENTKPNININIYNDILFSFLKIILENEYIISVVNGIMTNTVKITEKIFENIDVHTAIEMYNLLYKYNDIFCIGEEILNIIINLIKEKYKNTQMIILNSTIDDLWQNNVYKLYINDELFLVPLWHSELYFQRNNNEDLIVLCHPELPENVIIDENNNVIMSINIQFNNELIKNANEDNYKIINIGQQSFAIPIHELYIKQSQIYIFKHQGISLIQDDVYSTHNKSDVIFCIFMR